jgi:hypothetical protein
MRVCATGHAALIGTAVAVLAVPVAPVSGNVLRVPGDYPTIQAAPPAWP